MSQPETSYTIHGDKQYQQRARIALPYLVLYAKAEMQITYSYLAKLVGMPNPRNLNNVLGTIGSTLYHLGERHRKDIPQIQGLVVNKATGLPGEGIGGFIDEYTNMNNVGKRRVVKALHVKLFSYPGWDWVLNELNLPQVAVTSLEALDRAGRSGRGGGESKEHRLFKSYIAENPSVLGLADDIKGRVEELLPSADCIDVYFEHADLLIAVEVKSKISNSSDIERGIFQCVKYKCLVEARQISLGKYPNCRAILALQGKLPAEQVELKNLLGVEVIDNLLS
ncbi:MAG: hypothetical protein JKY70_21890 [Mucilaginibacter sp.]|nr:hypothetical protein [Mucilaginibacter sp.]